MVLRLCKRVIRLRYLTAVFVMAIAMLMSSAHAHLMVAQRGTLNFLNHDVFMVLSLPASVFTFADKNSDSALSIEEFSTHRADIINAVMSQVSLSDELGPLVLSDVMVSPVTPHDAPKEPAEHIVAMGKFSLSASTADNDNVSHSSNTKSDIARKLQFHIGLFKKQTDQQTITITASRKSLNLTHVFTLSKKENQAVLPFF